MRAPARLIPWLLPLLASVAHAQVINDVNRPDNARKVRVEAADFQRAQPVAKHANNNDLTDFGRWATYTKGLPHDEVGDTAPTDYDPFLAALLSGDPSQLEAVTLGGVRRFVNPQAGFSYVLEGADPQAITMRPAPDFDSPEVSGEMDELYWMSLVRDVRFDQYFSDTTIAQAINRLNQLRLYRGAKGSNGLVTTGTLFRADVGNAAQGPFISQFLLKTVPFGGGPLASESDINPNPAVEPTAHQPVEQRLWTRFPGDDRVTQYAEWRNIQNGAAPDDPVDTLEDFDNTRRYIRNGRDLAEWVHFDYPLQAPLNAALIMARQGDFLPDGKYDSDPKSSPRAEDPNNPYRFYAKQEPFVTFGNSEAQSVMALVTNTVLRAQWFQKWQTHRRLRPEEYGGRVHNTRVGPRGFPVPFELVNSPVLPLVFARNAQRNLERGLPGGGTYLLSQAFPEGSPLHPAYASGHSTYIGAGVTMLKAFYADFPVVRPQVSNADGTALQDYAGTLMMFDELDKLASNVGVARLFGGVHYRSDHDHASRLGELYALRALQDWTRLNPEPGPFGNPFPGYEVRTLGGNTLQVSANGPALPNHVSAVNHFVLVDRVTGNAIPGFKPLYNGAVIDLSDLKDAGFEKFDILASTYPPTVGSVRFVYDGTAYTDDTPNYSLDGDPNLPPVDLTVGTHSVRATPYSASAAGGLGGVPLVIRFTVQQ
ncbi:hypothetical protein [Pyxidicoccus xibeiensis]|uniref:hypothetical protein n=1 Tax=Pyxidicoccus xibeiensis TaxID=2906759 RepID=UPI0020A8152E|nr:hypothetical protein [Pyxidicoccus xibeiensis]MCP3136286.1 hypothetical protein [Pyxidicoccus xibeiensis]